MANIALAHQSLRSSWFRQLHAAVTCALLVAALVSPVALVDVESTSGRTAAQLEQSSSLVMLLGHGIQVLADGHASASLLMVVGGCGLVVTASWLVLAALVRARGHLDSGRRQLWMAGGAGVAIGGAGLLVAAVVPAAGCRIELAPSAVVLLGLAVSVVLRPLVERDSSV